jgi:hypothetical protein
MTAKKRWDIEHSRNEFSPHYMEHEKFSTKGHGRHPIEIYLRPGRIPYIGYGTYGLGKSVPKGTEKVNESAFDKGYKFGLEVYN